MSLPVNPLDKYSQYSYHHYLFAASSTEAVKHFDNQGYDYTELATIDKGELINIKNTSTGKSEKIILLVNPLTDSEFNIDTISYNVLVGDASGNMNIVNDLNMVIREPGGIRFPNFLEQIFNDILETSFLGSVFFVKTVFIGITPDGSPEVIHSIPSIPLLLLDMTMDISTLGSKYEVKFAGLNGGITRKHPYIGRITKSRNYTCNGQLRELVQDLERKLNEQSELEFNKKSNGRKVVYRIRLPESWKNFTIQKPGSIDNYEEGNTATGIGKMQFNAPPDTTVENVMEMFFSYCDEIKEKAAIRKKKERKNLSVWKITSSITSDETTMYVNYIVSEYEHLDPPEESDEPEKYGMVFDYIFSGKNTDIISFDLKLKNMVYFFNRNESTTAEKTNIDGSADQLTASENVKRQEMSLNKKQNSNMSTNPGKNDPVFPSQVPTKLLGSLSTNKERISRDQDYLEALARHSSMTAIDVSMEIRGNPYLLGQIITPTYSNDTNKFDSELANRSQGASSIGTAGNDITATNDRIPNANFIEYVPIFFKVNVYTQSVDNTSYDQKFWYNGWYRIMQIENVFNEGEFKQNIRGLANDIYADAGDA